MIEIDKDTYLENGGNPMTGVAGERNFYQNAGGLGVISTRDDGRMMAAVLRDSPYFEEKRVDESSRFSSHSDIEDAEGWLEENL